MADYYKVLGVSKNASSEEIKKAYRKLAHQHHPDKGGEEKKFKEINEAYQTLGNPQKRAQYDQFGRTFSAFGGPTGGWEGAPGGFGFEGFQGFPGGFDFRGFRDAKGFGDFSAKGGPASGWDFVDFGDIFEDFFGFEGGRKSKKRQRRGKDIAIDLEITLEEAFRGEDREIELQKMVVCPRCQGSGGEPGTKTVKCPTCDGRGEIYETHRSFFGTFSKVSACPKCGGDGKRPEKKCNECGGDGRVRKIEKISLHIPAGISDGEVIKLEEKGEAGELGSRPGDLYIRVHIKKHKHFKRKGDDIYYELSLNFSQAALGDVVLIPTLEGDASLKIPSGPESGEILTLRGKGMPHFYGSGRGDQIVVLKIKTPKKLTQKQKELMEKLKEENL